MISIKVKQALTLLWVLISFAAMGQEKIRVSGKVTDASSGAPLECATVSVLDNQNDQSLTGMITDEARQFQLEVSQADFYLKVSCLGCQELTYKDFEANDASIELGNSQVQPNNKALDEPVANGERSMHPGSIAQRPTFRSSILWLKGTTTSSLALTLQTPVLPDRRCFRW